MLFFGWGAFIAAGLVGMYYLGHAPWPAETEHATDSNDTAAVP
ncbi:hypothetical protein ABZ626_16830 [Streptomyces longispororuber]